MSKNALRNIVVYYVKQNNRKIWVRDVDETRWQILQGSPLSELIDTNEIIDKSTTTFLSPIQPQKIIGIGTNYCVTPDEAVEKTVPATFVMPPSAICSTGTNVKISEFFHSVLAEGELGVVVKKSAQRISRSEVTDYILGYTILNDISGNEGKIEKFSNFMKKSCDGFLPSGPGLLLCSELRDFSIQTEVNGKLCQSGNTAEMIYSIGECLEFITKFSTLAAGDVVSLGTPLPKPVIKEGDHVKVSIESLGSLENQIV